MTAPSRVHPSPASSDTVVAAPTGPVLPCLACHYARVGLAVDAPCPECGEPPLPADHIPIVGASSPSESTGVSFIGALLSLGAIAVALRTILQGSLTELWLSGCLLVAGLGLIITGRQKKSLESARGGDSLWIVTPTELVLVHGTRRRAIPFSTLRRCTVARDLLGRWQRLMLVPHFLSNGSTITCWLRRTKGEQPSPAERYRSLLTSRIEAAAAPRTEAGGVAD